MCNYFISVSLIHTMCRCTTRDLQYLITNGWFKQTIVNDFSVTTLLN